MADETPDIDAYQEALEGMLLVGEELEACFTGADEGASRSMVPDALAITTHRLILCDRELKRGSSDTWEFASIPYGQVEEVSLTRTEQFRRESIESVSTVVVRSRQGAGRSVTLRYRSPALAREVHDRILAHVLGL